MSEKRISKSIQRDSWSALKYALRFSYRLERKYLGDKQKKDDWAELLALYEKQEGLSVASTAHGSRMVTERRGGRLF